MVFMESSSSSKSLFSLPFVLMEFSSKSPLSLSWLLLLPLISLFFLIKQSRKKQGGNLPPTPPTLPIIGNLHQLGKLPHQSLWELSKKHGPVMLLKLGQIPTLVVSSPEMAKEVLKTHDLECCSRPNSYGIKKLTYNFVDIAFGPYNEYWREMRKLCVIELFTVKRVQSFWRVRDVEVAKFIDSLSKFEGQSVNLSEKLFHLTNAVICEIALGREYDGKEFKYMSGKFKEIMDEAMVLFSSFWVSDFFPRFGWYIDALMGLQKRLDRCFENLDGFFDLVIEEHLRPDRKKPENEDIVDILLRVSKDQTGVIRLSRDHIKSLVMDIYIGAVDTSSLTMAWTLTELTRNPRVMKKLQAEIRSVVGRNPKVNESDIEKLKYLKMVVKETFRLHPPAPLLLPHETMAHCKIGGYDVYPKTRVFVNPWGMGRDPNTWKNPEEFYPERFEDGEIDFRGANFELVPFGAGRRICPGLTMGSTNVEFTLASLLHSFDWKLPPGLRSEDISTEEEFGLTVHKKIPLCLVPIKYKWEEYEG